MKVNIYYGGRGLIEDPTIYVINKLAAVLAEIRVDVTRYNLYEEKNSITRLPNTLKEADGIILATHLEWMGIGGYMQEFLDACWLYGDKGKISSLYMMPVVMAETYGEREAELTLLKAWELLGGLSCSGLSAYVANHIEFETNPDYADFIEKKAESLYRAVNQKQINLPSSNHAIKSTMLRMNSIDLTPQESEQLSIYVSDDTYVKKQKEDIEELTKIFKDMLDGDGERTELGSTPWATANTVNSDAVHSNLIKAKPANRNLVKMHESDQNTVKPKAVNQNVVKSNAAHRNAVNQNLANQNAVNQNVVNQNAVKLPVQKKDQAGNLVPERRNSAVETADGKLETPKSKIDVIQPKPIEAKKEKPKPVPYISNFKKNFKPMIDFKASYAIYITDMNKTLVVEASTEKLNCYYGVKEDADVIAKTTQSVMDQLIQGRTTFQNAFMSGALTAKGDFKTLRIFDTIFQFNIL